MEEYARKVAPDVNWTSIELWTYEYLAVKRSRTDCFLSDGNAGAAGLGGGSWAALFGFTSYYVLAHEVSGFGWAIYNLCSMLSLNAENALVCLQRVHICGI